jgi:hypothetical protein
MAAPCVEGGLRKAYDTDGGAAFAVCACSGSGESRACSYTTPQKQVRGCDAEA